MTATFGTTSFESPIDPSTQRGRSYSLCGHAWLHCLLAAFILICVSVKSSVAQTTATWTGGGDGVSYGDASNWDIGVVPVNGGGSSYAVVVPGNPSIHFDVAGMGNVIDELQLDPNSSLTLGLGTDFTVANSASIDGARVFADVGSSGAIPVQAYAANAGGTLFSADGPGSSLDLSTMLTWSQSNFGGFVRRSVVATGGAAIDLSGLTTISNSSGDDDVEFRSASGGTIDLSSLTTIDGPSFFNIEASTFSLPLLGSTSGGGMSIARSAASTTNLPMLLSNDGGTWEVPAGGSINASIMTQLRNTTINIGTGGTLNAPNVVDVTGSTINLGAGQTLDTGALLAIQNTRFHLSGGASLATAASNYESNISGTVMSADGVGTELDLSSVQTWAQNNFGGFVRRSVVASGGANIDLSSLTTITNNSGDDDVEFRTISGGTIDLSGLATVDGPVYLNVDTPGYTLPSLQSVIGGLSIDRPAASTLTLPALQSTSGGTWNVPDGGMIDASSLTELHNTEVNVGDGGSLNIPVVTDISGSIINLGANQTINSAPITSMDNARVNLTGGANFSTSATAYVANVTGTVFSADGAGTDLDLSTIQSWTQNNFGGFGRRAVLASGDGHIDLSGLETIQNNSGDDDIFFQAVSGGTIDLTRLVTVDGPIVLDVETGGHIITGSPNTTVDGVSIDVRDMGSRVTVLGDLLMGPETSIHVQDTAAVEIAGNFTHQATSEPDVELSIASVWMNGSGGQFLEVASEDLGIDGSTTGNFGIGQLQVGDPNDSSAVNLLDSQDNGNRNGGAEALYLFGLGGPEGLRIAGGSVLVLNGVDVYAFDPLQGGQVHINSLFGPGDFRIPFDDGFLQLAVGDFLWSNPAGGSFGSTGNWQGGIAPLIADNAAWDLGSSGYTVTFTGSVGTNSAVIRNDTVTFDLNNHTFKVAGGGVPHAWVLAQSAGQQADLTVRNGMIAARSAILAEFAGSTASLTLDNASAFVTSTLTFGEGTTDLVLTNGSQLIVGDRLDLGPNATIALTNGTISVGQSQPPQSNQTLKINSQGTLSGSGAVDGDLDTEGLIEVMANSVTDHDLITFTGSASLAGSIAVELGFVPTLGSELVIIDAVGGVTGMFDEVLGVDVIVSGQATVVDYTATTVRLFTTLPGDANVDGAVDGSDFLIWNANKFTNTPGWRNGDFNADGTIDGQDFLIWNNFKFQAVDRIAAVPEPSSSAMLALLLVFGTSRLSRSASRAAV